MNLNSHRWILLAVTCSLAGCTLISPPDSHYVSNPKVSHLRDRAAGVQAKAAKHQLSLVESEKFLHESMGVAEILRGVDGDGDKERLASIHRFEARLKSLLARRTPLRSSDVIDLGADIQQLDGLFRTRWVRSTDDPDEPAATSESITDSTTTCTEEERKKEKEKKDKEKKRDRDRDDKKRDHHRGDDDKKRDR
jgi:hypothetical protein